MPAQFFGRADARRLPYPLPRSREPLGLVAALALEVRPESAAAGHRVLRHQGIQRIAEELESLLATSDRLGAILVDREGRDHGDVGVDAVAERDAVLALDDVVIDGTPAPCLVRIDEGESERAEAEAGGDPDGLAVGAGHPHRRRGAFVRPLEGACATHRARTLLPKRAHGRAPQSAPI